MIALITGGCKSGKSRFALNLCEKISVSKRGFIATCQPMDAEMHDRVKKHKQERDDTWSTIEEPKALKSAILKAGASHDVLLIDCITLWINNLLMEIDNSDDIMAHVSDLLIGIQKVDCPIVFVSNEVGAGIVPENKLARKYRDLVGMTNQQIANCADEVVYMVAGIPMKIKSAPSSLPQLGPLLA